MQQKLSALLIVLFIGSIVSLTTKSKLSPFENALLPQNSIMKRLNDVFIQLKSIDDSTSNVKTFSAFVDVIKGLISDLDKDTQKHFEILQEMQAKCTDEDNFRTNEVSDAVKAIENASSSRKVCQEKLDKATLLKTESENLLEAEKTKKQQRTETREAERKIYESEKQQYDDAIAFLTDFIVMVNNKLGGDVKTSFIEFSEKLLRHTAGLKRLDAAVPVLIMLSQYTAGVAGDYKEFNAGDANKTLREKLDFLLKTLQDDLAKITETENQRIKDFQEFLVKVNKNIEDLIAAIEDLKNQIQHTKECVARETAIVNEASNKQSRNAELKQKAIDMCRKFVDEVEEAQKSRRTELAVVREILSLLEIRFKKVPENLTSYLASIESKFAEYENKTKLIAFVVYQHAPLAENAHGKDIVADTQNYVDNKKF